MNTELVFFDAHRLANVVFHRVAFAILDSFKRRVYEHGSCLQ